MENTDISTSGVMPPDQRAENKDTKSDTSKDGEKSPKLWDPERNAQKPLDDTVISSEGKGDVEYKTCEWW